jgi:MFS transporter, putative metabolite:H+ symporter
MHRIERELGKRAMGGRLPRGSTLLQGYSMQVTAVNAGARLDRLPVSKFHWRVLGLIAGGMFLDAFEIYLAGGVLGALVKSGWSDLARNAQFISATFAGMVVGAWVAGVLGDRYGRRFSYQANLLIFGLASFAAAAAPSMAWLIVARFVMGLGLGAEIVVGYVTMSEFVPPQQRAKWGAGLSALTNTALFVSSFAGFLIIPTAGWRWMFVIVGVGALFVWYLRKAMPESPRWLESKGRTSEAEQVMRDIEAEVAKTQPIAPIGELSAPAAAPDRSFLRLFSKQLITRTIVGSVVLVALNTVIYGFVAWVPTFLVKQGMSVVSSLGFTTLMSLGGPVGALIGMWLGDRLGRKRGIIAFSVVAMLLGILYPYSNHPIFLSLVGFALVTVLYILVAFAFALYVPELFPTEVRMRGAGFCNTIGRMMTIVTPYMVAAIFGGYGIGGVVGLMVAFLAVETLVVALLGIETKQKPLEAIAPAHVEGVSPGKLRTA